MASGMNYIDRGKGICPKCRAEVRLIAFTGSTSDPRSGGSVIGRHHIGNVKVHRKCDGWRELPVGGNS